VRECGEGQAAAAGGSGRVDGGCGEGEDERGGYGEEAEAVR